ncbi:hypothetical protein ON010_g11950 [Phytophthora cinnamomi]|nr:hypothetical protein ON010_g11950 [Phytophthora cinnamomi]
MCGAAVRVDCRLTALLPALLARRRLRQPAHVHAADVPERRPGVRRAGQREGARPGAQRQRHRGTHGGLLAARVRAGRGQHPATGGDLRLQVGWPVRGAPTWHAVRGGGLRGERLHLHVPQQPASRAHHRGAVLAVLHGVPRRHADRRVSEQFRLARPPAQARGQHAGAIRQGGATEHRVQPQAHGAAVRGSLQHSPEV